MEDALAEIAVKVLRVKGRSSRVNVPSFLWSSLLESNGVQMERFGSGFVTAARATQTRQ